MTEIRAPVFLLDPEASSSSGKEHIISNIEACTPLFKTLVATFGPYGRDKLIVQSDGKFSVSNDGAFILSSLKISHPVASLVRDVSLAQDDAAGDGTTSVCLLSVGLLKELAKELDKGLSVHVLLEGLIKAETLLVSLLEKNSIDLHSEKFEENLNLKKRRSPQSSLEAGENKSVLSKEKNRDSLSVITKNFFRKLVSEKSSENITSSSTTKPSSELTTKLSIAIDICKTALSSKIVNIDRDKYSLLLVHALLNPILSIPKSFSLSFSEALSTTSLPLNEHSSKFTSFLPTISSLSSSSFHSKINFVLEEGGKSHDSFFFPGVVFRKAFSYAGFEQQPKLLLHGPIALLEIELELKTEKDTAEIRLSSSAEYGRVVDAEFALFRGRLNSIIEAFRSSAFLFREGSQKLSPGKECSGKGERECLGIVLSTMPIGDFATQYFAEHGVFCAGRIQSSVLRRVERMTGARVLSKLPVVEEGVPGLEAERRRGLQKLKEAGVLESSGLLGYHREVNGSPGEIGGEMSREEERGVEGGKKVEEVRRALGLFDYFEERRLGESRYNFLSSQFHSRHVVEFQTLDLLEGRSDNPRPNNKGQNSTDEEAIRKEAMEGTLVLRGGSKKYLEEVRRALEDAEKSCRLFLNASRTIVPGGGYIECLLANELLEAARVVEGGGVELESGEFQKEAFRSTGEGEVYRAFARALEKLPFVLADNAGFDGLELVGKLREEVRRGNLVGLNLDDGEIQEGIVAVEPVEAKVAAVRAVVELAGTVLQIGETVKDRPTQRMD